MIDFFKQLSSGKKTIVVGLIHISIILLHSILIALGETRSACADGVALYDVVHNLAKNGIAPFAWFSRIPTNQIVLTLTITFVVLLVLNKKRWGYLRRFFVFHSILSIIRAISIWITTIPSPDSECHSRLLASADVMDRALSLTLGAIGIPWDWFQIGIPGNTCCDCIISGHTATLMVLGMLITQLIQNKTIQISVWIAILIGLCGLMVPPWHYSIDVFLTVIISWFVISFYMNATKNNPNSFVRFIENE